MQTRFERVPLGFVPCVLTDPALLAEHMAGVTGEDPGGPISAELHAAYAAVPGQDDLPLAVVRGGLELADEGILYEPKVGYTGRKYWPSEPSAAAALKRLGFTGSYASWERQGVYARIECEMHQPFGWPYPQPVKSQRYVRLTVGGRSREVYGPRDLAFWAGELQPPVPEPVKGAEAVPAAPLLAAGALVCAGAAGSAVDALRTLGGLCRLSPKGAVVEQGQGVAILRFATSAGQARYELAVSLEEGEVMPGQAFRLLEKWPAKDFPGSQPAWSIEATAGGYRLIIKDRVRAILEGRSIETCNQPVNIEPIQPGHPEVELNPYQVQELKAALKLAGETMEGHCAMAWEVEGGHLRLDWQGRGDYHGGIESYCPGRGAPLTRAMELKDMAIPSDKSPEMEQALDDVTQRQFGRTRTQSIRENKCVSCGGDASQFTDPLSQKEYGISGLCTWERLKHDVRLNMRLDKPNEGEAEPRGMES